MFRVYEYCFGAAAAQTVPSEPYLSSLTVMQSSTPVTVADAKLTGAVAVPPPTAPEVETVAVFVPFVAEPRLDAYVHESVPPAARSYGNATGQLTASDAPKKVSETDSMRAANGAGLSITIVPFAA